MSLAIRPAKLADAPTLARLYRRAYVSAERLGFPTHATEATAADLSTWIREASVYVACNVGRLVGSVRYRESGKYDSEAAEFGRLAVVERARGSGVGTRLVDHVEGRAAREGNERIRLRTFADHPFLPAMYRRRGYRTDRIRPIEGAPFDVLHMEKILRA